MYVDDEFNRLESLLQSGRISEARQLADQIKETAEREDHRWLCFAAQLFAVHGADATDLLDAALWLAEDYEGTERRIETRYVRDIKYDVVRYLGGDSSVKLPVHRRIYQLAKADMKLAQVRPDLVVVSAGLLERLNRDPAGFHELTPRQFEEVVGELFHRSGYSVTLGPGTRDGGVDVWAVRKDKVGEFLCIAECKRYSPQRRVGVQVVRALYGTQQMHRANASLLATTSTFTTGAVEHRNEIGYQMTLKDFEALLECLCQVLK